MLTSDGSEEECEMVMIASFDGVVLPKPIAEVLQNMIQAYQKGHAFSVIWQDGCSACSDKPGTGLFFWGCEPEQIAKAVAHEIEAERRSIN